MAVVYVGVEGHGEDFPDVLTSYFIEFADNT